MGNCLRTSKNGAINDEDETGGAPAKRIPREENLHLFSGRIINNEGRVGSASIFTQQGRKGVNQDAMLLWDKFGEAQQGVLCGVFDGHGPQGHLVARRVRDILPLKLLSALPKGKPEVDLPLTEWRRAFAKAYKCVDKDLRSCSRLDCFCSGSTGVTVLKMGMNLYMGNIGDSRAILGTKDENTGEIKAVQLTVDLKPDLPREAERIKKCKGRVFALQDEPEVPRVWLPFDDAPGLAMARAFGDFCLKDYGVISVPEFSHFVLSDNDQFVVLASDGVWDVLTNKEAVEIISSSPTRHTAARRVVAAADREWKSKYPTSKMDDCAVVCLFLNPGIPNPEDSEIQESNSPVSSEGNSTRNSGSNAENNIFLTRNNTVRSSENGWLGLDGVTRVNSLVQLPRFSGDREVA